MYHGWWLARPGSWVIAVIALIAVIADWGCWGAALLGALTDPHLAPSRAATAIIDLQGGGNHNDGGGWPRPH